MQILHGTWLSAEKRFVLWGEDCETASPFVNRKRKLRYHPFQTDAHFLLQIISQYDDDATVEGLKQPIWLPSNENYAQASPEALQRGAIAINGKLALRKWQLELLGLCFDDALGFLLRATDQLKGNYRLGKDLIYWRQVAYFLMSCFLQGRYAPILDREGWQYRAKWQVRPDAMAIERFGSTMPSLCRAMVKQIENAPDALTLLTDFLSVGIDTLIRGFYKNKQQVFDHFWVRALCSNDNLLRVDSTTAKNFYYEWERWQAAGAWTGSTFRICLRLSEPEEEKDIWRLDYLLQANDDPSLIVPAIEVWAAEGQTFGLLERRFESPKQKLLAGLGIASKIFTPIERSLRTRKPAFEELSREEAYQFLIDGLPRLQNLGFVVLVPNWWHSKPDIKIKPRIKSQANNSGGFLTKESLLSYEWWLSVGDESISQEEFETLVALKQPLVRFKDRWISLDPREIEAALRYLEQADKKVSFIDFLKADKDIETEIEVEEIEISDDLATTMEFIYRPELARIPPLPMALNASLRPYQERGYGWLWQMRQMSLGTCLADDMGLGKTLQTISLWLCERENGVIKAPALVVCPTSVIGNWKHEIQKFAPSLRVAVHQGAERLDDIELFKTQLELVDVVLTSYAVLRRDSELLEFIDWSDVVLDEAQNIKNPATKQAQAARKLRAEFKLALTGTPVENHLIELWSIMQFLNPGYLGSQKSFKTNFVNPIERDNEVVRDKLRRLIAPFMLRRMKTDPDIIQDLPDKFENKVYCSLTPEQATLYDAEVREAFRTIELSDDEITRSGNVLRMLTRLKQICNHPAQFLKQDMDRLEHRSGKFERLVEMLEEVQENGESALIFTQYAKMGTLLQNYFKQHLPETDVFFLHGGVRPKDRETMITQFERGDQSRLFILSLKAGGTGLNLTAANHVFHFDRWYNPSVENQATDRAFRHGQTKNVQVHKFIVLGTLEQQIDEMIEHKRGLADSILGSGENWISELNDEELRDLVRLRYEVVEDF